MSNGVVLTNVTPPSRSHAAFCSLRYIIAQSCSVFPKLPVDWSTPPLFFSLCVVLQSAVLASSPEKQPERPRILGIDHVSVYVSDIEKSRQFYSEVLGLTTNCPQYAGS